MAKLNLPQSYGEREKLAKYIRKTLNTYNLRNNWLIQQLRNEGFIIYATSLCDALAVRCMTPKTDEFLARAEQICKLYEQSCFGQTRSGSLETGQSVHERATGHLRADLPRDIRQSAELLKGVIYGKIQSWG